MKLVVLSPPEPVAREFEIVNRLFAEGMESYHLRKPAFSAGEMEECMRKISAEFHNRLCIHSHYPLAAQYKLKGIHRTSRESGNGLWQQVRQEHPALRTSASFHELDELRAAGTEEYEYVFFSPVFDSISKQGHAARYPESILKEAITHARYRVVALGGIAEDKIERAGELGAYGVGILGAIWKSPDPVETFRAIKNKCVCMKGIAKHSRG